MIDSSGMRFYYSSTAREHDAGIMYLGHEINTAMIILPGTPNYTIAGVCSADCTKSVCICFNMCSVYFANNYTSLCPQYFPDGGITIFANLLHTHLEGLCFETLQ